MTAAVPAEEMQRLLDRAAHDLRAVFRRIETSVEIFDRNPKHDVFPPLLDSVAHGMAILSAIEVYSTAMGVARYSFKPLKVDVPLDAALARLDGRIQETHATVSRSSLPEIVGDRERLTDLFYILLANTLTYRGEKAPIVDVRARDEAGAWIVSIQDNGIGIASKYHGELFRPFYRLHGSEIPGVGLGLATCQKIMEAHQGRIWLESEAGAGATFSFSLPA
jgi:light-regulated signal transduction histidine kinase (bacteriophytochrome)